MYLNILKKLATGESFSSRIARSSMWVGLGGGADKILRLVRNIILTRLLAPDAFGVMAIVLSINAFLESFTEIGIKNAIIQHADGEQSTYLNGAWWLGFIRSVVLYLLAFLAAPFFAVFYNEPNLAVLMRMAFLAIIFKGTMSSQVFVAMKKMRFKSWVIISSGGSVIGVIATIILALCMNNVWALVIGFTLEAAVRSILSFIVCPFWPGFAFNREHVNSLLRYARGMLGIPILYFIFIRTDIFVIGKMLSTSDLGLYSMVADLARMPLIFLGTIIGHVMMPAFSEIQTNSARLNQTIRKSTTFIAFIGFPALFFVILFGRELLSITYGKAYAAMAIPFAIVFAAEFLRVASTPISTVYLASGRPELHRLFSGIRAICMVVLIYPLVQWFGLAGAALSGFIAMTVGYVFQVNRIGKITGLQLAPYWRIFLSAFCVSLIFPALWIITNIFLPQKTVIKILSGTLMCLFTYGFSLIYLSRSLKHKLVVN